MDWYCENSSAKCLLLKLASCRKYSQYLTRHILHPFYISLKAHSHPSLHPPLLKGHNKLLLSHPPLRISRELRGAWSATELTAATLVRQHADTSAHTSTCDHTCTHTRTAAANVWPTHDTRTYTRSHVHTTVGWPCISLICMLMNLAAGPKHLLPLGPSAPHLPLWKVTKWSH